MSYGQYKCGTVDALFNLEGTGKIVPKKDVEAEYGPIAQLARAHDW